MVRVLELHIHNYIFLNMFHIFFLTIVSLNFYDSCIWTSHPDLFFSKHVTYNFASCTLLLDVYANSGWTAWFTLFLVKTSVLSIDTETEKVMKLVEFFWIYLLECKLGVCCSCTVQMYRTTTWMTLHIRLWSGQQQISLTASDGLFQQTLLEAYEICWSCKLCRMWRNRQSLDMLLDSLHWTRKCF